MKSELLRKYASIIDDLTEVIKRRKFPIYKLETEQNPEQISFEYKTISSQKTEQIKKQQKIYTPKKIGFNERNYTCNLCQNRLNGIRNFSIRGTYPILVLYYSGETNPNKDMFIKTKENQIFKTLEEANLFERMIQKAFGFSYTNFYYQEFPACNFSHQTSTDKDWFERTNSCTKLVNETIQKEKIRGTIFLGQSGVLFFGKKKAEKLLSEIFTQFELPSILLRSPASLVAIEKKKNQFEQLSQDFNKWKKEEIKVKTQILTQLNHYKERMGNMQ